MKQMGEHHRRSTTYVALPELDENEDFDICSEDIWNILMDPLPVHEKIRLAQCLITTFQLKLQEINHGQQNPR